VDCWDLESNKDKRPKNWKKKEETGASEIDGRNVDMCIDCADQGTVLGDIAGATGGEFTEFSDDIIVMLSDRNIWIGNTGARSGHSTFNVTGVINVKETSAKDQVTVGNGE
jgi:hypothetical protein